MTTIPERIMRSLINQRDETIAITLATRDGKWEACVEFVYGVLLYGGTADTPGAALERLALRMRDQHLGIA